MDAVTERIAASKDAAQQMVTALLHGDRTLAADIAVEHPDELALALVLGDLCAYVHKRWCNATGLTSAEAGESWVELMADVEEWRARGAGR